MAKIATRQTRSSSVKPSTSPVRQILNETAEIEKLAYQFFLDRGCEHGHHEEDWLRAESIVRKRKR